MLTWYVFSIVDNQDREILTIHPANAIPVMASDRNICPIEASISHFDLFNPELGLIVNDTLILNAEIEFMVSFEQTSSIALPPEPRTNCVPNLPAAALSHYAQLYVSKIGSDMILLSNDGKEFPVHRAVLIAHSSVFAAMLSYDCVETLTGRCKIEDADGETLETVLKFMYAYTAEVGEENVEKVVAIADKYDLGDLVSICGDRLANRVTVENAARLMILGDQRNLPVLLEKVLEFVAGNKNGFIQAGGVEEVASFDSALLSRLFRHMT